ncbi:hypothetical protein Bbelb_370330 [Branchiostoma belcheri]|nr:hypothetical protein Bbelb_370330 [Branchiostoma belcheri]
MATEVSSVYVTRLLVRLINLKRKIVVSNKKTSHCASRFLANLSKQLSADERHLEIIGETVRPSSLGKRYQQLESTEWVAAKEQIDDNSSIPSQDSLRLLCFLMDAAYNAARPEVTRREAQTQYLLLSPVQCQTPSSTDTNGTTEPQCTEGLVPPMISQTMKNEILKCIKKTSHLIDLSGLEDSVKVKAAETFTLPEGFFDSHGETQKYLKACCRLAWQFHLLPADSAPTLPAITVRVPVVAQFGIARRKFVDAWVRKANAEILNAGPPLLRQRCPGDVEGIRADVEGTRADVEGIRANPVSTDVVVLVVLTTIVLLSEVKVRSKEAYLRQYELRRLQKRLKDGESPSKKDRRYREVDIAKQIPNDKYQCMVFHFVHKWSERFSEFFCDGDVSQDKKDLEGLPTKFLIELKKRIEKCHCGEDNVLSLLLQKYLETVTVFGKSPVEFVALDGDNPGGKPFCEVCDRKVRFYSELPNFLQELGVSGKGDESGRRQRKELLSQLTTLFAKMAENP